jgi:hypothetical protein
MGLRNASVSEAVEVLWNPAFFVVGLLKERLKLFPGKDAIAVSVAQSIVAFNVCIQRCCIDKEATLDFGYDPRLEGIGCIGRYESAEVIRKVGPRICSINIEAQ